MSIKKTYTGDYSADGYDDGIKDGIKDGKQGQAKEAKEGLAKLNLKTMAFLLTGKLDFSEQNPCLPT